MLAELTIQNLVIVEKALLQPGEGLVVISGETGAGKSLLLDAIDLVSGARARPGLVGRWGEAATVSAVFQIDSARAARIAAMAHVEVEDGQVIVRRRVAEGGRSQGWINDQAVTVSTLREVAGELIDLHAQHEPIRLAEPAVQLELLDAFGGHAEVVERYRTVHVQVTEHEGELAEIDGMGKDGAKEVDYLAFQLAAFDDLQPQPGELAKLEQRQALLSSAGTWRDLSAEAVQTLVDGDKALATQIGRLVRRLDGAPDPRLVQAGESLRVALEQIREAGSACSAAADAIESDPEALAAVEARLDRWNDLLRKHGPDEAALFATWEALSARLRALRTAGERREGVVKALFEACKQRLRVGAELATARRTAFERLALAVHEHLAELGMPKARLTLVESEIAVPTRHGTCQQAFQVCTNPGQQPGSIRDIASGGEASRLMLALSAALANSDQMPLLVFDEVDSGVGGRLGVAIGGKLARLATGRTVLAVTHTPQVAACGHRQYVVRKHQGEASTTVSVAPVAGDLRVAEIADMLGGGAAALSQSRSLLRMTNEAPMQVPVTKNRGERS